MRDTEFKINLSVKEAYNLLADNDFAEIVDKELRELENDKTLAIIVFEKYFVRVSNRVSMVVIIDDLDGYTRIKAVGSGGGRGVYSSFDWGASNSFEISVEKLFKEYLENKE